MEHQNNQTCREAHKIDGVIPQEKDIHLAGRNCDCGRISFYVQSCNCPNGGQGALKSKPNE